MRKVRDFLHNDDGLPLEILVIFATVLIILALALPLWGLSVILFDVLIVFAPLLIVAGLVYGIFKAVHYYRSHHGAHR